MRDERELEVAVRAVRGDRDAHQRLISMKEEDYRRAMLAAARAIIGNDHDAEDAVQRALVKSLESIRELRDPARARSWFIKLARNQAHDIVKSKRRRAALLHELRSSEDACDRLESNQMRQAPHRPAARERGISPLDSAERKEALARIEGAIPRLGERDQLIVRMLLLGLPRQEIRARLGLTPQALRKAIGRAQHHLAAALVHGGTAAA